MYLAEHHTLKTPVALKVLDKTRANDATARQRFVREAQTAAQLNHPRIVKINDLFEAPEGLGIPMDYFPEGNLKQWRELIASPPSGGEKHSPGDGYRRGAFLV